MQKIISVNSFGASLELGKPQAIAATAHKLARVVYHLLSTREAYNESVFNRCDEEAITARSIPTPETSRTTRVSGHPLQNGSCSLGVGLSPVIVNHS
jgi:hypothetical protein